MKVKTSMIVEIEITTDIEGTGILLEKTGSKEHKDKWEKQLGRQIAKELTDYNTLDRLKIVKFYSCKSSK